MANDVDIFHGATLNFATSGFESEIESIDCDWEIEREVVEITDNRSGNLAGVVDNYKQSLGAFIFGILAGQEVRIRCHHLKDQLVTNPVNAPPEVITVTLPETLDSVSTPAKIVFTGGVRRMEGRWPMRGAGEVTLHIKVTSGQIVFTKEATA
jgi:hypothetical protein